MESTVKHGISWTVFNRNSILGRWRKLFCQGRAFAGGENAKDDQCHTLCKHFRPSPNNSRISQQLPEKPAKLAKKKLPKKHRAEQFLNDSCVSGDMLPITHFLSTEFDHKLKLI